MIGEELAQAILNADQSTEPGIFAQRERVQAAQARSWPAPARSEARDLLAVADALVKKSVWIVGGDGWAYDIGYGGLDHVLASGRNVNILVLDTEVYSNTGGQASKATPRGAVAKFAAGGKPVRQEGPGHDGHELRQRLRGARWPWAPATCTPSRRSWKPRPTTGRRSSSPTAIASPTATTWPTAWTSRRLAVNSGYWPLFRYNPDLVAQGKNPFQLDSRAPSHPAQGLHLQRDALHHAGRRAIPKKPRGCWSWRRRTSPATGSCTTTWRTKPGAPRR